jgi:aldose 1-epimerase
MVRKHRRALIALASPALAISVTLAWTEQPYAVRTADDGVQLEDAAHRTTVSIATARGNTVYSMKVNGHEVVRWPNGGIPLLAPWANRLDEPAFYANGKKYPFDLALGNVRGPIPIHGFLQATDRWQPVGSRSDVDSASVTSRLEFFREPMWMKQWPFAHEIEVTHVLKEGTLEIRTTLKNLSSEPMPVAIGFHPYFQLTDAPRDEWTISIPARTRWLLADNKVPTGETEPAAKLVGAAETTPLKDLNLDDVFSDLERDAHGRATMTVQGKSQRLDVTVGPNFHALVVYAPAGRDFICFEPMAGITNALNLAHRGVYKELQTIQAGGVWQESFWIRPSGFVTREKSGGIVNDQGAAHAPSPGHFHR